jgi:hypothetical protein
MRAKALCTEMPEDKDDPQTAIAILSNHSFSGNLVAVIFHRDAGTISRCFLDACASTLLPGWQVSFSICIPQADHEATAIRRCVCEFVCFPAVTGKQGEAIVSNPDSLGFFNVDLTTSRSQEDEQNKRQLEGLSSKTDACSGKSTKEKDP